MLHIQQRFVISFYLNASHISVEIDCKIFALFCMSQRKWFIFRALECNSASMQGIEKFFFTINWAKKQFSTSKQRVLLYAIMYQCICTLLTNTTSTTFKGGYFHRCERLATYILHETKEMSGEWPLDAVNIGRGVRGCLWQICHTFICKWRSTTDAKTALFLSHLFL